MIHPTDFVYRDPVHAAMTSWKKAGAQLAALPAERRPRKFEEYLAAARNHPDPRVKWEVEKLGVSGGAQEVDLILLGAASVGELTVFVETGKGTEVLEITADVWTGAMLPAANPALSASTGRFEVLTTYRPSGARDLELAGHPLFLATRDVGRLLKTSSASERARLEIGRKIIDAFKEQRPNEVMTKDAYCRALWKELPGVSKAQLRRDRLTLEPAWRNFKGGRQPRRPT